jgi:predicted DNA binding protein
MWVAKFKLRDDEDIYSPLCEKNELEIFAVPYTAFEKENKINVIVGVILSGNENAKRGFISDLKKDARVKKIEKHQDFLIVHAQHKSSFEAKSEIKRFYNPEYIRIKPIHLAKDGWEYWEVACLDRKELNKLIDAAVKYHHGVIFSIKEEKIKSISSLELIPRLSNKQFEALKEAYQKGYYNCPRKLTIIELAKTAKKAYSTFQEHLSKAENKLVDFFIKYR